MGILELQKLAINNGVNSLRFRFKDYFGNWIYGQWIDAYFGFFSIDRIGEREMINVSSWKREFGDNRFEFEVLKDNQQEKTIKK